MNTPESHLAPQPLPRESLRAPKSRRSLHIQCAACGWAGELGSSWQLAGAPELADCGWCGGSIPNPWKLADAEPSSAENALPPGELRAAVRLNQSGGVRFSLFDPGSVHFNYLHESETVKTSRTRKHDRAVRLVAKPLAFVGLMVAAIIAFLLFRPIQTDAPVAAEPIEYVPAALKAEVESARAVLARYFAARDIEVKMSCVLPGITPAQMQDYFASGGADVAVPVQNIVFSAKHSDTPRHWLSFSVIPEGTFREIRVYVSTLGSVPLMHWPAYIQEKDEFAQQVAEAKEAGEHFLRVGVCRAASLEGKPRVVLISPGGETLCYAALDVPAAEEIMGALDYTKPASATLSLRTGIYGEKSVARWNSWGFDRPEVRVASSDQAVPTTAN